MAKTYWHIEVWHSCMTKSFFKFYESPRDENIQVLLFTLDT